MKISRTLLASLLLSSTVFVAPAMASSKTASIDPHALALLKRMSATLSGAKSFTCKTQGILEVPAITGQFVTFFADGRIALKRPNKLAIRVAGDGPHFDFYYDGDSVSAYAPSTGVYSTLKAPPTIDEMLPGLKAETGIRFPTAPLFYSNPYAVLTRGIFSGVVVGSSKIGGATCDHLAFRSPGVNWEIWIETGGRNLPRRLTMTFTDRPYAPRLMVTFSDWALNPWLLSDSAFVFHKPAGAKEIPFSAVMQSARRQTKP